LFTIAGVLATRMYGRPAVVPPVRTLAVFPFTLRGGAPNGYLRDGMVDLMSAKLEGASGFHAIDPRSVLSAVAGQENGAAPDPETDTRIARQLGAGWYISGDVTEVAGRLQINGTLVDLGAGSQTIATASVSGDTAALFEMVDDLAGRMLARLSRGRDATPRPRLPSATRPRSTPGLRWRNTVWRSPPPGSMPRTRRIPLCGPRRPPGTTSA
jgi:TolB-like protein